MNEAEPKYSRRQAIGLLGGVGATLLAKPFRTFAQEIEDQPVASEDKTETGPALVEPRHNYDKIRLYYPVEFNNLPREQRIEYNLALRRSREWLKKLFTSTDQLNHTKLNEYVDQFMMAVAHIPPAEKITYLSDFEVVMPTFLPRSYMEERGQQIAEQGFNSPFTLGLGPWSRREDGLIWGINIREPYLPQESTPAFDYNNPHSSTYPILMFGYTMNSLLRYHDQVQQLVLEGSFNRDQFIQDIYIPVKAIFTIAESLKTMVQIHQELGLRGTPVFQGLTTRRLLIEKIYPPEQVEFEWRKFIWSVFISKDIPVDQLR